MGGGRGEEHDRTGSGKGIGGHAINPYLQTAININRGAPPELEVKKPCTREEIRKLPSLGYAATSASMPTSKRTTGEPTNPYWG